MSWLLLNWRLVSFAVVCFSLFIAGWHANTIWRTYHEQAAEIRAISNLGKGEINIIETEQKIHKEISNAKDDCTGKLIPINIKRLLK
jgi:hypothetical protein